MESESLRKYKTQPSINPWLIIMLTAPLPVMLFLFFFFKWYQQRTDFSRVTQQFVQRQNTVMAYDAIRVSHEISHLLEGAARDVRLLSLLGPTAENFRKFYLSEIPQITHLNDHGFVHHHHPLPLYNELAFYDLKGNERLRLVHGKVIQSGRSFSDCSEVQLCDRGLLEAILREPIGSTEVGSLLKWYSPEGSAEDDEGATLRVAYRSAQGIFTLGLDYRHLKAILFLPTFPYQEKSDLLQSYQSGNYIYFVDGETHIISHPKYWHVIGIDKKTGKRVAPMRTDADDGKHPIRIAAYESGKLKAYFDRLLTRSFVQQTVDIFQSPNLRGAIRVLSVAPILLSIGRFKKTGVFGHVITGCSVDYFEEPKEKVIPYY